MQLGDVKGYRISGFQPDLRFCISDPNNVKEDNINRFATCINLCLQGFPVEYIVKSIKKPGTFIIWCTNSLRYDSLQNMQINVENNNFKETLCGVGVVRKYVFKRPSFVFYEVVFLGVHPKFRGMDIGSKLLDYLKGLCKNSLIILHPDCTTIVFYLSDRNGFYYYKTLIYGLRDFVQYLFTNKSPQYKRIFKRVKKDMSDSIDCPLNLSTVRGHYCNVLFCHTSYRDFYAIRNEYFNYIGNNLTPQNFKLILDGNLSLEFLPSNFRQICVSRNIRVSNLFNVKVKLGLEFNTVYRKLSPFEVKAQILDEINENFLFYKKQKPPKKKQNLDKKEIWKKNKFYYYIYINRLIFIYNNIFHDKIPQYFDSEMLEIIRKCNSIQKARNTIVDEIGDYSFILKTIQSLRIKQQELLKKRKDCLSYTKISFKLKRFEDLKEFYNFFDFFELLQNEESLRKNIQNVLQSYSKNQLQNNYGLVVSNMFDLCLLINRLITFHNKNFCGKKIKVFIDNRNRANFRTYISQLIANINLCNSYTISRYRYLNYATYLNDLLKKV